MNMDDSETANYEGTQNMKVPSSVVNVSRTGSLLQPDLQLPSTGSLAARTDLALERSGMAAERTLTAWIRTSISMISFGFTLGKLRDALGSAEVKLIFGRTTDVMGVAYFLVILGTVVLILAGIQFKIETTALVGAD